MPRLKPFSRATALKHGRFIFVYNNVRTNQVLYSLSRTLEDSHLKQLSYFGKKTIPPRVRKDMWHPLLTIVFPRGREREGLIVYQRLREYRLFRDVNWRKREDLLEHEAFGRKELDQDEPKKPLWNARKKILMDQKADTIADVAAILERQAILEAERTADIEAKEAKKAELQAHRDRKWKESAENGKVKVLESNIRNLEKALARGRAQGKEAPATEEEKRTWERQIRKHIGRLSWELSQIRRTTNPQPKDKSSKTKIPEDNVSELIRELEKLQIRGPPKHMRARKARHEWQRTADDLLEEALGEARLIRQKQVLSMTTIAESTQRVDNIVERRRALVSEPKGAEYQSWRYADEIDKVRIQWLDLEDAQYAQRWPEDVVHDVMGRTRVERFTAPKPDLLSKPGLSKEEEAHMEENVRLDGEANEEGPEEAEEETEGEGQGNEGEGETSGEKGDGGEKKASGRKWNPLSWGKRGGEEARP